MQRRCPQATAKTRPAEKAQTRSAAEGAKTKSAGEAQTRSAAEMPSGDSED